MQLLTFIIITSLASAGIFTVTRPGMLLNFIRRWYYQLTNKVATKSLVGGRFLVWVVHPLFDCLICIASFWSIVFWFALGMQLSLTELVIAILAVCGGNTILAKVIYGYSPDTE